MRILAAEAFKSFRMAPKKKPRSGSERGKEEGK
jgi:hypothetical protein